MTVSKPSSTHQARKLFFIFGFCTCWQACRSVPLASDAEKNSAQSSYVTTGHGRSSTKDSFGGWLCGGHGHGGRLSGGRCYNRFVDLLNNLDHDSLYHHCDRGNN